MEILEEKRTIATSTRSSSEEWGTASDDDVLDSAYQADMDSIERVLAEHESLEEHNLIREIEIMDSVLEDA